MRIVTNRYLKELKRDLKGSFAIPMALTGALMVFAIGSAVDYTNFLTAQNVARKALDSASLAAAVRLDQGRSFDGQNGARDEAEDVFALNIQASKLIDFNAVTGSLQVTQVPGSNEVVASADVVVPTYFAGIFGFDRLQSKVRSTAGFQPDITEFVFVLDTTTSMNSRLKGTKNSRIETLRTSMLDTITLLEDSINNDLVRVGIVPYATSVNLGTHHRDAVGRFTVSVTENNNTCVTEREGNRANQDVMPILVRTPVEAKAPAAIETFYETDSQLRSRDRFNNFASCPSVPIRPLTNNVRGLRKDINALRADGITAGHIGLDWGFNLLSQNWQDFWPEASRPADYRTPNVRKVIVLLTDGEFNTQFIDNGPRPSFSNASVEVSNDVTLELCDLAKAPSRGMEIYTIAFGDIAEEGEAAGPAQTLLQDCANDDDHFFPATNGDELSAAFEAIIEQIIEPRLTQ